jgi:phosphoenolpyruvate-protein phosphotransferase (PTS system enzyme I)
MELKGIPASPGCASGLVTIVRSAAAHAPLSAAAPLDADEEIARFYSGREACRKHCEGLLQACRDRGAEQEAALLAGYQELILDVELEKDICAAIRQQGFSAENAAQTVLETIIQDMESLEDPYLRERAFDFQEIKKLLLRGIRGEALAATRLEHPAVLVGRELGPADTAAIDPAMLLAIVSETGGATSHLAILAQNLGIPAVVGVNKALEVLGDGDEVFVDGTAGSVLLRPEAASLKQFHARRENDLETQRILHELKDLPAVTLDGTRITLSANVDGEAGVEAALRYGAEGIGLFRSEFLFFDRQPPTEEAQFRVYRKAVTRFPHGRVIFRTFDLGGDKPPPWLSGGSEQNPFLGWRGARLYREHRDLLQAQLRAVLRAGSYGPAAVMFPMVIAKGELGELLSVVDDVKRDLRRRGVSFNEKVPIGTMIETPAAALIADQLIQRVDFASIGTNDLTQYTLAVDRGNQRVAALYDSFHPAVLRLIGEVIHAAGARNKIASMCGELCGDERATALLLGLGLRSFSVSPPKIPRIKRAIRDTDLSAAEQLAAEALGATFRW